MPPSASSTRPARSPAAPVNAPRAWPNSSLSISDSGSAPTLTGHERPLRAARQQVHRARDELLARAALAQQQHRAVGRRDARDELQQALHARARADDGRSASRRPRRGGARAGMSGAQGSLVRAETPGASIGGSGRRGASRRVDCFKMAQRPRRRGKLSGRNAPVFAGSFALQLDEPQLGRAPPLQRRAATAARGAPPTCPTSGSPAASLSSRRR